MRTRGDFINQYAKGWATGNDTLILEACTHGYVFYDPNLDEPVTYARFPSYFEDLLRSSKYKSGTFMNITDVLISPDMSFVSCWWTVPSIMGLEGAGLIRVSDQGITSERVAYYTKIR